MAVQQRADLRSAYLYLICLVTLVLALFAAVGLVRAGVQLAYPDPAYYGVEALHPDGGKVDPQELARRERAARDSQRHQAAVSLVGSAAMLLLAGPTYAYHWRRVQAEHRRPAVDAPLP